MRRGHVSAYLFPLFACTIVQIDRTIVVYCLEERDGNQSCQFVKRDGTCVYSSDTPCGCHVGARNARSKYIMILGKGSTTEALTNKDIRQLVGQACTALPVDGK